MTVNHKDVSHHYTAGDLGNQILAALTAMGKDVDALTMDDLTPVDQFHIRGQAATEELMQWTNIRPEQRLLDVGCGLGGTSRYLAVNTGCSVVGVDLTVEYCQVAEMLSARVGFEVSHLVGLDELDALLGNARFSRVRWEDKTEASVNFFRTVLERQWTDGPALLGLHLLMGDDAAVKFGNMLRNLEDDSLQVVQAVESLMFE